MNKRLRRALALTLVGLLALGTLSACQTEKTVAETEQEVQTEKTESTHEPLTICASLLDFQALTEALAKYYPEIVLEPVSYKGGNTSGYLQQLLENGDISDIYADTYFRDSELLKQSLLDLSQYDFVNRYSDAILNQVDVDGSIYVVPSAFHVQGIYYNKTMFQEHGWSAPTSFQELVALMAQIEEETDITPIRSNLRLTGHPFNYFFSMNNTGFFGTPAGDKWKKDFLAGNAQAAGNLEDCVAYFQEWIDAGVFQTQDVGSRAGLDEFIDGKVAMVVNLSISWSYEPSDGSSFEVGIIPWLSEDGTNNMLTSVVNRYFGLNKTLAEPGNEQKLEDALKVMDFLSSDEGQELLNADVEGVLPLKNSSIQSDSPLYEVHDLIEQGYTVPLVYLGWVDHLLYPIAEGLNSMILGDMTGEELIEMMDEVNAQIQEDPYGDTIAVATEYFTKEQAARLAGMAMIDAADCDAALVSVGDYIDDFQNRYGVNAGIYPNHLTQESINVFSPWGTDTVVMEFTGAELEALAQLGADVDGQGVRFPYVLTVRDDAALEADETYTVAFSLGDYDPAYGERPMELLGQTVANILGEYLASYDTLSVDDLVWK